MRHNAAITIHFTDSARKHPSDRTYTIFFDSKGTPAEVKFIIRNALRGMRRVIRHDVEKFYINIIGHAFRKKIPLNITPYAATYLWQYVIDFRFTRDVPNISLINLSNGLDKTLPLFRWLGPEREISEKEPSKRPEHYGKRRGRPSALRTDSRLQARYVPAPREILPDGTVIYGDARDKLKDH